MPDDYSANAQTTGTVAVGGSTTGTIETAYDRDWYAVELVAGRTYVIDLRGRPTDDGTLSDPYLRGIHDADGNRISNTTNDDGGQSYNSRVTFTATESGTHYIAAGAYSSRRGTYEVEVTDTSPPETPQEQVQQQPPAFDRQAYLFEFEENADGSTDRLSLGTVSATDPDGGSVSYGIEGGNESGRFEIDAASGELFYVGGGEDYETGSTSFELTVRASDGDQTTDTSVTVNVTDVDEPVVDDPPVAQEVQSTPQTVSEPDGEDFSADPSTSGRVAVGDTGTGRIGSSGDRDWFAVELVAGRTYVIDLRGRPTDDGTLSDPYLRGIYDADGNRISNTTNDDGGQSYNSRVTFTATESGTHYIAAGAYSSRRGTYEVEVTDTSPPETPQEQVQQQPPAFDRQAYLFDLEENADGSTDRLSLGTVSATDPDGGSVSYGIEGGNESGRFEIDAASGELFYVGAGEDYETGSTSFELTVRASDGDQTTDTSVTVNVTDVDEPVVDDPPVAQEVQSTPQTVSEPDGEDFSADPSTSGRVAVGDTGTGRIGSSGDRDWFAVELVAGRTYVIDLRGRPTDDGTLSDPYLRGIYDADGNRISNTTNDDGGQSYNSRVTFTATESGTHYIAAGAYSSRRGTYEVEVTDTSPPETPQEQVQQQPPAFDRQAYLFEFEENADGSTDRLSLGTVSATDPDGGSVSYGIEGGNESGRFEIDAASGELFYVGAGEDYETGSTSFELTVRASDGDQTTDTAVTVNVTDVDEPVEVEPPVVAQEVQSVPQTVSEGTTDLPAGYSTPGRVVVGESVTGQIGSPGDRDGFFVDLEAGATYRIRLDGAARELWSVTDPDGDHVVTRGWAVHFFTAELTGTYHVEVSGDRTSQGAYTLSIAEVGESLANDYANDPQTTGSVAVGGSVFGNRNYANDQDWFAVDLDAGRTYWIDLEGAFTVGSLLDPQIFGIHDSDGNFIPGTTDHDGGYRTNSRVTFTPNESATYYISAGGYSNGEEVTYRLSVRDVTDGVPDDYSADTETAGRAVVGEGVTGKIESDGDQDWFAVELEAGRMYRVHADGLTVQSTHIAGIYDSQGNALPDTEGVGTQSGIEQSFFRPGENGTYYVAVEAGSDDIQGKYRLQIDVVEDDYGTAADTAGAVAVGSPASGRIDYWEDEDWFAVELEAGKTYQLDLEGAATTGAGDLRDPYLRGVYDPNGNFVEGTEHDDIDTLFNRNSRTLFSPSENGTHYIAAGGWRNDTGSYRLSVSAVRDDHAASRGTTATVVAGGSAEGRIEYAGDQDWFRVFLEAGQTYQVDVKGWWSGDPGSTALRDPTLIGVHDEDGILIPGTTDDDSGAGRNSRVNFTAPENGTYYVAAGAFGDGQGTYQVSVEAVIDGL